MFYCFDRNNYVKIGFASKPDNDFSIDNEREFDIASIERYFSISLFLGYL